jgi:geranylgeranyl diphosphate synthase, type II
VTQTAANEPVRGSGYLQVQQQRVEEALREVVRRYLDGTQATLAEPLEYALSTSGKRLRPVLCIAAYEAAAKQEVPGSLYRLSCAIEVVHTYSLVHDDLPCMDDDDLRRGRPTVHRVHGSARAVIAGAALLPIAVELLDREGESLGLDLPTRAVLIVELARGAGAMGMVGGQLLDLNAEGRPPGPGELERIHRLKTGCLLTCALRIGAIAGGASALLLEALTRYGSALGLAFQIADDLLDVEGTSAEIGKVPGRDIALNKASYPSVYGMDGARALAASKALEAKQAISAFDLPELARITDFVVKRRT